MTKVYTLEVCVCSEGGCMELFKVFSSESAAIEFAESCGYQTEHYHSEYGDYRTDFYEVREMEVK